MKKGTFKFVLCGFDENAGMVGGFMVYFQNIRALDSILCIDTENFYSPQTNACVALKRKCIKVGFLASNNHFSSRIDKKEVQGTR